MKVPNVTYPARAVLLFEEFAEAADLIVKHGYRSWDDLKYKLVQPQVRLALILSANQMSARESYSENGPILLR